MAVQIRLGAFKVNDREDWAKTLTAVGFEPTPLRTGALSQRLRPLGQTVTRSTDSRGRGARY